MTWTVALKAGTLVSFSLLDAEDDDAWSGAVSLIRLWFRRIFVADHVAFSFFFSSLSSRVTMTLVSQRQRGIPLLPPLHLLLQPLRQLELPDEQRKSAFFSFRFRYLVCC